MKHDLFFCLLHYGSVTLRFIEKVLVLACWTFLLYLAFLLWSHLFPSIALLLHSVGNKVKFPHTVFGYQNIRLFCTEALWSCVASRIVETELWVAGVPVEVITWHPERVPPSTTSSIEFLGIFRFLLWCLLLPCILGSGTYYYIHVINFYFVHMHNPGLSMLYFSEHRQKDKHLS